MCVALPPLQLSLPTHCFPSRRKLFGVNQAPGTPVPPALGAARTMPAEPACEVACLAYVEAARTFALQNI